MIQAQIDFDISRKQNSVANQEIFEEAKPRLSNQCRVILAAFERGRRLTVSQAAGYGVWDHKDEKTVFVGDLRARVRDLIALGYNVQSEKLPGGFKEYFISQENKN